jgi:hypothetical protein
MGASFGITNLEHGSARRQERRIASLEEVRRVTEVAGVLAAHAREHLRRGLAHPIAVIVPVDDARHRRSLHLIVRVVSQVAPHPLDPLARADLVVRY